MSHETKQKGALPKKFKQNYHELIDEKKITFLIDDFEEINIVDPFPDENEFTTTVIMHFPEQASDFVYPVNRLIYSLTPSSIYFPSKKIVCKLMRACIGVTDVDDLWFNQKEEE